MSVIPTTLHNRQRLENARLRDRRLARAEEFIFPFDNTSLPDDFDTVDNRNERRLINLHRVPNDREDMIRYLPGYVDYGRERENVSIESNESFDYDIMRNDSDIEIPENEFVAEARLNRLVNIDTNDHNPRFGMNEFFRTLMEEIKEMGPLNLIILLFVGFYIWSVMMASRSCKVIINISM